jgi:alpha-galactosidase
MKALRHFLLLLFAALATFSFGQTAKTPPMGWNSWNWFGKQDINETVVREVIDAMVSTGLRDAGYRYVVIDGGWRDTALAPDGRLVPHPVKFPHGIKPLADYAHSKGLRLGLHTVPGTHDCGGDRVGGLGVEAVQVKEFADWGIDFIKLDLCQNKATGWNEANIRETYYKWNDLLKHSGRDIRFSISAYKFRDWYPEVADMARTTWDVACRRYGGANFDSNKQGVMTIAWMNNDAADFAGHGYWNDPDMLVVGDQGLTVEEQKVHFALWCLMSAPLMLGNDPRKMEDYEREILLNPECLAVDQDSTEQGRRILADKGIEVWLKHMSNGDRVFLVINRSAPSPVDYELMIEGMCKPDKLRVHDLYSHQDLAHNGRIMKLHLTPHSGRFLRVGTE